MHRINHCLLFSYWYFRQQIIRSVASQVLLVLAIGMVRVRGARQDLFVMSLLPCHHFLLPVLVLFSGGFQTSSIM